MQNKYLLKNKCTKILLYLIIFFILIYIIYKVIIIIITLITVNDITIDKNKENFTSGFRQMYRPYVRNIRLNSEGFYNKTKNNIQIIFRKFGFI